VKRVKGISEFIALLIIVGIVIGAAIVGSGIISNILMKQSPKGADVVGRLFWLWEKLDNGYVLYIHGPLTNVGSEVVNITRIEVSYGGKKYNANFTKMTLRPGDYNEILARTTVDTLPPTTSISVIVHYCMQSGCSASVIPASVRLTEYLSSYEVVTVTIPVTTTVTRTTTTTISGSATVTTVTMSVPTTVTTTRTVTSTTTQTATVTTAMITTTTVTSISTVTKPAWLIDFSACYSVYNNIVVVGILDKSVNKDAEYIPYVAKYFKCNVFGCSEVAVKPFAWTSAKDIISSYGPIDPPWFGHFKVEVWSVDPSSGELTEKIWESNVDPNTRCA